MGGRDRAPGPLTIRPSFDGDPDSIAAFADPDGEWIVFANRDEEITIPPEYQRLFAAAPDLLEACHGGPNAMENALAFNLDYFAAMIEEDDFKITKGTVVAVLRQYAAILRAAVAKATVS